MCAGGGRRRNGLPFLVVVGIGNGQRSGSTAFLCCSGRFCQRAIFAQPSHNPQSYLIHVNHTWIHRSIWSEWVPYPKSYLIHVNHTWILFPLALRSRKDDSIQLEFNMPLLDMHHFLRPVV